MSTKSYSGPTPVTKSDQKIAKKHLKATQDLLEDKIDDHESAKETAQDAGNQPSVKYNNTHLQGHKKDLAQVEQSLKTVKNLKPVIKQPQPSPGLVGYVTKKKYGAKALASMSR